VAAWRPSAIPKLFPWVTPFSGSASVVCAPKMSGRSRPCSGTFGRAQHCPRWRPPGVGHPADDLTERSDRISDLNRLDALTG
jgi:hypothetical protein